MDPIEDVPDRVLMDQAAGGDADAFGEIFRRHRDRMWALAVHLTHDRELAADAVQDGFLKAFRNVGSYRGDASVSTWLHRIVANACLDRLRRERDQLRRAGDLAELDLIDDHDRHDQALTALQVHRALAQLPEHQRLALTLVDLQDLGVAEAAQVLGVAEGTIKSRCARARSALADILREPQAPRERPTPGST